MATERGFFSVSLSIPFVFRLTRKSNVDKVIGQMAYPVYLSHMLIIHLVLSKHGFGYDAGGAVVVLASMASYLVYWLIDRNVDRLKVRHVNVLKDHTKNAGGELVKA